MESLELIERTKEEVVQLHIDCVRSLRSYMAEANQTCKLLVQIDKFPVSAGDRISILEQRQRENVAFEQYRDARARLFDAAKWDDS